MAENKLSFWNRPEGTTGKVLLAGAALGLLYIISLMLPWLMDVVENTLYLAVLSGVVFLLYVIATAERTRTLIFYFFQMISRLITGVFVAIDPVAILKGFAKRMEAKLEEVVKSIARIAGVERTLKMQLAKSEQEMRDALRLAEAAEKKGDQDSLNVMTERAGRRMANIQAIKNMLRVVVEIREALDRIRGRVEYHIANSNDEMEQLITMHNLAKETKAATDSASSVLGNSDALDVRNQAADDIRTRYNNALGELDVLVDMSKELDQEIDLNTLAFRSDGQTKLNELRSKIAQAESNDGTAPRQLHAGNPPLVTIPRYELPADPIVQESEWQKRLRKRDNGK